MARKTFLNGYPLPASDLNTYLMDQAVQTYADATARTTALPTPVEGQVTYLEDTNLLYVWDGSAWTSVGQIADGSITNAKLANSSVSINGNSVALGASTTLDIGRNKIINGAFDWWHRGTSGSNTGAVSYTADRWSSVTYAGGTMNWSQQPTSTTLFNSQYCARVQRPSGATNTATMNLGYSLETKDSLPLRGKTVTLSFWARAGANYSPSGSVLNYTISTGTGTDQNVWGFTGSGGTGYTATLTTSWQKFTATQTLNTSLTELGFNFYSQVTGTAGANDYYEIAEVQLEAGSVATPFSRAGGTLQGELAACQRYTQVFDGPQNFSVLPAGFLAASTVAEATFSMPVQMRVAPTSLTATSMQFYNIANAGAYSGGSFTLGNGTKNIAAIRYTHGSSMGSLGNPGVFTPNSTTGGILLSAEL